MSQPRMAYISSFLTSISGPTESICARVSVQDQLLVSLILWGQFKSFNSVRAVGIVEYQESGLLLALGP